MAEIKVTKRNTPAWPWIVVALIIAGFLIYYFGFRDKQHTEAAMMVDPPSAQNQPEAVNSYLMYIDSGKAMGLDHAYTSNALLKLASAVSAKAEQVGVNISADLQKVNEHADHITNDPFETTHANSIREAADILTRIMQNMQQAKYPALVNGVEAVREAASSINPDVLTLDQREQVKSFFERSADLLTQMA